MSNEPLNIAGKSVGEVGRDIAAFLSRTCVVQARQEMDLANLLPDLNMREQFSFALLMEARTQGWTSTAAETFFRRICAPLVGEEITARMLAAFADPEGEDFALLEERYGCRFSLSSHSYWTSCLAVSIDAKAISALLEYLRAFTFCLMEFAYMEDRNPSRTYAWSYYESFSGILNELTTPIEQPEAIAVRSVGGSAGKRERDSYPLSLGLDLENPNKTLLAWNTQVDITLKDKDGNVISRIQDQINCIDPDSIFHYGITRRIQGAAVAHITASARSESFTSVKAPIMKQIKLSRVSFKKTEREGILRGLLVSEYDRPISSFALHYQFLSADNKILGGGCEWFFEALSAGEERELVARCPVPVKNAVKVVYSVDFDAQELLKE